MNPNELCAKLEGVIGFPVTPFHDDHSLDLDGHRKNVRYMLEQPMCALVAAGGTGELYSLTCLLYTSPSPRDQRGSRMPSSA